MLNFCWGGMSGSVLPQPSAFLEWCSEGLESDSDGRTDIQRNCIRIQKRSGQNAWCYTCREKLRMKTEDWVILVALEGNVYSLWTKSVEPVLWNSQGLSPRSQDCTHCSWFWARRKHSTHPCLQSVYLNFLNHRSLCPLIHFLPIYAFSGTI
jgi:hypothetical protein